MLSHRWTQSVDQATGFPQEPVLLFAAGDFRLLAHLQRWCDRMHRPLYLSQPDSQDLILLPYFAAVVDRRFVGKTAWTHFCQYRHLALQPVPHELEEEFPDLEAGLDPLVIVADRESPVFGEINPYNLFFIPPSRPDEVLRLLDLRTSCPRGVSRDDFNPRHS
ncbi:MAG: hypothetical protein ACM3YO_01010 [Bacteroidota bacterium]